MKKIIVLLGVFLLFPLITWAQEKIEAPVWKVGDTWVFTQGKIKVIGADENSYTLKFSKDTSIMETKGFDKIIFDKSTLNRIYTLKDDNREKYTKGHRRILNFPLNLGGEWKDTFTSQILLGPLKGTSANFSEAVKVIGWEDVKVKAGDFKTIKLEYTQALGTKLSGKAIYWYAPEVKYFVKCIYDKSYFMGLADWELVSFKLKK